MLRAFIFSIIFLSLGCAHIAETDHAKRNPSQLDHIADNVDSPIDPSLETSFPDERENSNKVGEVIAGFNKDQQKIRQKMLEKVKNNKASEKEIRIVNDLQKPIESNRAYASRDVHRKTHGCYVGELNLKPADQLLQEMNQKISEIRLSREKAKEIGEQFGSLPELITKEELGVFGQGSVKDIIVRYSNGTPSNSPDKAPDARGMAIKIFPHGTINKPVAQFSSANILNEQSLLDILTINFPVFFVNDPVKYIKINEYFLASKLDNEPWYAKISEGISIYFAGMSEEEIALALATNGSIIESAAFQKYHSMVPSRIGYEGKARAIKYEFSPVACDSSNSSIARFEENKKTFMPEWSLRRIYADPAKPNRDDKLPVQNYSRDYLRDRMQEHLNSGDICFELKGDLYRDQVNTNIEDSTDFWATSEEGKKLFKYNVRKNMEFFNSKYISTFDRDYGYKIDDKKIVPQVVLGKIRISNKFNEEANKNSKVCEDLSFNPWNGKLNSPYHKPLGVVSRMKRRVYQASRNERHCLNKVGPCEPEKK